MAEKTQEERIFIEKEPEVTLGNVVLEDETRRRLDKVVLENENRLKLSLHNLLPRRRLLFYGPPGTGKTFSGEALAGEMKMPFYIFNLESLANGDSESALLILEKGFDFISQTRGIFLFDEFDAIAANRGSQNASSGGGDGRRIVNDLLIHFETFTGEAVIICATNFLECVDGAFRRRFDTICHFALPSNEERLDILMRTLARFDMEPSKIELEAVIKATQGLSFHETEEVAKNAAKTAILMDKPLSLVEELRGIVDRKDAFRKNFEG